MHLTRVGGDDITSKRFYRATPAGGSLRAIFQQPHAKHRMSMATEVAAAIQVRAIDARPWRTQNLCVVVRRLLHVA